MAEGSQDRIDIALGADTSGLDDAERRSLAFVDRISETLGTAGQKLPALDLNVGPLAQTLRQAGGDVSRFFADLQQLGTSGASETLSELSRTLALTGLQFRANSDEGRAFEAVVRDIDAAQARLRQTGSLALTAPGAASAPGGPPPPPPTTPTLLASQDDTRLAQNAAANAAALASMGRAAAEASAQTTTLSASIREGLTFQERMGVAAAQAATGLSVQARAAEASAAATAAAASAGAGPLAAAALGAVAATNTLAAAETRADAGTRTWAAGLAIAERQLVALRSAEDAAATGSGRVTAGFAGATEQRAALDAVAAATAKAAGETEKGTRAFGEHEKAGRRAATALGILATESVGATGPVGRLAESVLLFSGGEIAIAGVAAAVLVAVKAYEFFTTAERQAREENERMVSSLVQEANQALPAVERAQRGIVATIEAQTQARRDLQRQVLLGGDPEQKGFSLSPIEDELARRAKERLTQATRAQGQAERDEARAVSEFQSLNVQTLTQAISLRTANAFQIRQAQGFVQVLEQQERDANRPLTERIALHQQLLTLQTALRDDAGASSIRSVASQSLDADRAIQQQAIDRQQQALQASFAQELITRDQFYTRRRELAVSAAQADITALAGKLEANLSQSSPDPAIQRAIEAQSAALRSQIELRKGLLGITEDQLTAEKALAEQSLLIRSGIGFLAPGAEGKPPVDIGGTSTPTQAPEIAPVTVKPRFDFTQVDRDIETIAAHTREITLDQSFDRATRAGEELDRLLLQINLKLKDVGNANVEEPSFESLSQQVNNVTRGLDGLVSSARNIGAIGDEAAAAIGSVENLAGAIASVSEKASAGNILGLIGAGIGVVGSIGSALGIGKSQTERDLEAAQRENTAALHNATRAFEASQGRFQGAGGIAEQQTIVQRVLDSPDARAALESGDLNAFRAAVQDTGISLDELREIARSQGISLVQDHHLVEGGSTALAKALQIAGEAATHFGTSLAERQGVLETEDKLGLGGRSSDPEVARIQRVRELELGGPGTQGPGLHLSAEDEARIRALDLTTKAGQDAFKQFQQSLFQRSQAGTLTKAELGTFKDVEELRGPINDAADGLNALADATAAATKNMQNVPDISTLAELEFRSRSPQGPGDGATLPLPTIPFGPGPDALHGTDFNPPVPGVDTTPVVGTVDRLAPLLRTSLTELGGGATLQDILDQLRAPVGSTPLPRTATLPTADPTAIRSPLESFGTAARAMVEALRQQAAGVQAKPSVVHQLYGDVVLHFPTTPENPDALIKAVKDGQVRASLAATGQED